MKTFSPCCRLDREHAAIREEQRIKVLLPPNPSACLASVKETKAGTDSPIGRPLSQPLPIKNPPKAVMRSSKRSLMKVRGSDCGCRTPPPRQFVDFPGTHFRSIRHSPWRELGLRAPKLGNVDRPGIPGAFSELAAALRSRTRIRSPGRHCSWGVNPHDHHIPREPWLTSLRAREPWARTRR